MKKQRYVNLFEKYTTIFLSDAYWISPRGKIISVKTNHMAEILENPRSFGVTIELLKSKFKLHKEKLGVEGKAREELFLTLFKKGWIRLRKYIRQGTWSININRLGTKAKDILQQWAEMYIKNGGSKYDAIIVDTPYAQIDKYNMNDIAKYKMFKAEESRKRKYILKFVEKLKIKDNNYGTIY